MLVAISNWKSRHHHVSITNGFNLADFFFNYNKKGKKWLLTIKSLLKIQGASNDSIIYSLNTHNKILAQHLHRRFTGIEYNETV